MTEEIRPVSFAVDGHPDEEQLLLALERELPAEDATRVEDHLGNCWSCRARSDEMQRGILAFVEYREKRYLPSLATPPYDYSSFGERLRNLRNEESPVGLWTRVLRRLVTFFTFSVQVNGQVKWVSAVATIMAIVIFWVQVVSPPLVSATELLTRAVAAQNPPPSGGKNARHLVARQKVQIRTGDNVIVRDFEWNVGAAPSLRWDPQPDPLAWNAPMTAEAFARWRNSLREKKDEVKRAGNLLTLDTTAGQDSIKEAWMVVRADTFHPVEQHLRFADNQQLDFTELAFQISDAPQPATRPATPATVAPKPSIPAPLPAGPDLEEVELQLRYALFVNHWDLEDDLTIGRAAGEVTLAGTIGSREREQAMRETLSTLPNLRLSLDLPAAAAAAAAGQVQPSNRATAKQPALSTPLLKDVLEKAFASRELRLEFVDRCLADSDTTLSHAWALKRLVDRYSESEELLLKPDSDDKLRAMLRAHLEELSRANSGLEPLFEMLPASGVALPQIPSDWRAQILSLFAAVQQQDRLVASLVAGSQANRLDIAGASAEFRSARELTKALLGVLKSLPGERTVK